MDLKPAKPIYLKSADETIFGLFHEPPDGVAAQRAVLICAPWGWDEVASYRSRRLWAERLAAAGHPTLRFDLPSSGDSSGSAGDPARIRAWVAAIGVSSEWLAAAARGSGVALVGLGLGGLLARQAVADGAPAEDLVLWASPRAGRAFVRETRAFSRLQPWGPSRDAEHDLSPLPQGWLEAGGFVLSAETLEELSSLEPQLPPSASLQRVLLLERDGIEVDQGLRESLEAGGVAVSVAPGEGWGKMVSHPERTLAPLEVFDRVQSWLSQGGERGPARSLRGAALGASGALELGLGPGEIRESALEFELPFGRAFAILAEPLAEPVPGLCAVFFNAGAVRHIGPNRLWTETAREWAARGLRTVRIDLEAIGEADGDSSRLTEVSEFYIPQYEEQVVSVLDSLVQRGLGNRFVLAGLCVGGFWSFRTALRDPRISEAVLLNAGALLWHSELLAEREARKLGRVFERRWWHKFMRGEIGLHRLRALAASLIERTGHRVRGAARRLGGRGEALEDSRDVVALLNRLRETETPVVMAFSADEPLYADLEAADIPAHLERWPNLELSALPGNDHTLRPIAAQRAARALLDRELERILSRVGGEA